MRVGLAAMLGAACGGAGSAPAATPPTTPTTPTTPLAPVIPAIGDANVIDMATWNLEWFGDPANGPTNETQQAANIRAAIAAADLDLWAVQEVVSASAFRSLVAALPGYGGVLANDPAVVGGAASYSDFNDAEQKVGLLVKSAVASVIGARVILTERDFDFAGRPPVEFRLRVTLGGVVDTIPVIVLHAKAGSDAASWDASSATATALTEAPEGGSCCDYKNRLFIAGEPATETHSRTMTIPCYVVGLPITTKGLTATPSTLDMGEQSMNKQSGMRSVEYSILMRNNFWQ